MEQREPGKCVSLLLTYLLHSPSLLKMTSRGLVHHPAVLLESALGVEQAYAGAALVGAGVVSSEMPHF